MHPSSEGNHLLVKMLLIVCSVDDNDITSEVDTNVVYVSDICKNSEQRDDQCRGLLTSILRSPGFNKSMSIASLTINGLHTHFDDVALLTKSWEFIFLPCVNLSLVLPSPEN